MKVTVACIIAALIPLVATFAPGFTHRRNIAQLFAASDDVPEIVKAYKKIKAEPTFPELPKIPETPTPEPPVNSYVEAVPTPPLSELKVELPPVEVPGSDIQSAVSDSIESMKQSLSSIPSVPSVPSINLQKTADQVNAQFKGFNDFMKATQEQMAVRAVDQGPNRVPTLGEMIHNGLAAPKRATFTETTMVPEGKAPTLVEYVLGGFKSPTGGISTDTLAESKAKMSLLVENTFSLFGTSAPDSVDLNLPGNMSPETAAGLAVAGVAVLVMAGQNNKNDRPAPVKPVSIEETEEEGPLTGLAKDVKKMAEQIQRLSDETKSLRSELKQAQDRLTQKELDISKERLKSADMELTLKREIQKVSLKLMESEAKNKALEKELAATADMRATLTMSLEKIQALEQKLKVSSKDDVVAPAPAPAKEKAPSPAKAKVAEPKPEPAPAPAPKPAPKTSAKKAPSPAKEKLSSPAPVTKKEETPAPEPVVAEAPKSTPTSKAPSPAPAKKTATTSRKKAVTAPKEKAPIEIIDVKPTAKSKKTTETKKSKETAKKADPVSDSSENWSSLSDSTLSRKTVKELMDYLSDKGVETNDTDGKPLKKALLLEAVRSL